MIPILKQLFNGKDKNNMIVVENNAQAHAIKNKIQSDLITSTVKLRKEKHRQMKTLTAIEQEITSIAEAFAIATGGKERGL